MASVMEQDHMDTDLGEARRLREVYQHKKLYPGEDLRLIRRIRKGRAPGATAFQISDGDDALRRLIHGVEQYVWSAARKLSNRGVETEDLVQHGLRGVMRALDDFDESRKCTFLTYADKWIYQRMMRSIEREGSTSRYGARVPGHQFVANGKVHRVLENLRDDLGRDPTAEEVAVSAKLVKADSNPNVRQAERALELLNRRFISLDAQRGASDDSDVSIADAIADENAEDPEAVALSQANRKIVQEVFAQLNDQERQVLELRFGIGIDKPMTQDEVCAQMDIKKSRLLRIQRNATERLRGSQRLRDVAASIMA